MIGHGCGGSCNQGRSACDCERTPSRGLPVLVILCAAAPLLILALSGCVKRVSTESRIEQLEHRLQTHEQAGCRGVRDPEPTAQRERAVSMAAKRGGGVV